MREAEVGKCGAPALVEFVDQPPIVGVGETLLVRTV
jgi:hypothetical protein